MAHPNGQQTNGVANAAAGLGIPREMIDDPSHGLTRLDRFQKENGPLYLPAPTHQQQQRNGPLYSPAPTRREQEQREQQQWEQQQREQQQWEQQQWEQQNGNSSAAMGTAAMGTAAAGTHTSNGDTKLAVFQLTAHRKHSLVSLSSQLLRLRRPLLMHK
ncbi:unnamed protein product [Tuber aestivum]|uniref:Uncharacterized protein n=1 Tax=Tuber aestivum TaxID=59557 RepID=A0A292Q0Y7_9PEZI|nr:unnamed protein product [Tuber aestivum]